MKKEDLRLRSWYGDGLFKEEGTVHVLAYDVNDKKMLERDCNFFTEEMRVMAVINGSEVYGNLEKDLDNFITILSEYKSADVDVFKDELFETEDHDVEQALRKAHDFVNSFKLKEVYRNKETGEIFVIKEIDFLMEDMSLYEKEVIAVEK